MTLRGFKESDIPKIAQMWRESDEAWPGSFGGRGGLTPELVRKWEKKSHSHSFYLIEKDDRIVGYCKNKVGAKDTLYIDLLNVSPDCHGKGYGKQLLLKTIDSATEEGFEMVEIGTWPSNMKSVPLYKKVGFYWLPETEGVWMKNFIPKIRRNSFAKDYFTKHDWYKTFQRGLKQEEDDLDWRGIKAIPYIWQADGDLLKVRVDMEAKTFVEFENNDFAVSCYIGEEKVIAGDENTVKWELENKSNKPLAITLLAKGEDGFTLSKEESFQLEGKRVIEEKFTIDKKSEGRGQIKTDLVIDGRVLPLGISTELKQAVDIEPNPKHLCLKPNREGKFGLKLSNNSAESIAGSLFITSDPSLTFDKREADFELEAKEVIELPFSIKAEDKGVKNFDVYGQLKLQDKEIKTKKRTFSIISLPLGEAIGKLCDDEVVLENDDLRLEIPLKGCVFNVLRKSDNKRVAKITKGEIGPPFILPWEDWLDKRKFEGEVSVEDGKAKCVLSIESPKKEGLILQRTIIMSALPVIEIKDRIINNSSLDYKSLQVSLNAHCQSGSRRFVIVTEKGIIDEPLMIASSFPDWGDISDDPKDYPEDWVCIESERFATGVIGWHHAEEILLDDYWTSLIFNAPEVKRQSHTDLPPIYFYAGEGGWRTVRHYWQKLIRGDIEEEKELEAEGVIQIGFDHNPLVIERGNNEVQLTVNNRRIIELNGELKLEAPEGIALSEDKLTLEGINLNKSFSKRLTLKCNDNDLPSRVYMIKAEIDEEVLTTANELPLILLEDKKAEFNIREEGRIIEVDNGNLTMKSAPDYKGSIFSIERNGIERVLSSFPKPGNFGRERPWYGGIQPVINGESFQLHKEKFAYEIVEKIGLQGVEWRGVKVLCEPEHRLYRWLRLETEYLTASDSDIIAIISRYINKTTASQKFNGGIRIFLRIGCERDSILHFQRDGKSYRKKRTNRYASGVNCGSWAALENPKTNELEIIVVARGIDIFAFDYSEDLGMHPTISKEFTLKPEEAKEIVSYLIIRDNKINPEDYSVMTNLRELP